MGNLLGYLKLSPRTFTCGIEIPEIHGLTTKRLIRVFKEAGFVVKKSSECGDLQMASSSSILVCTDHEANSATEALVTHFRKMEPVLDMLAFYLANTPSILQDKGWAGIDSSRLEQVELPKYSANLVHAHSNADQLVIHAMHANYSARFEGSVSNALDLHCTAMQANDVRTRFLNLWAALECLGSLSEGKSVLQRVLNLVGPIVTWRKIESQARYCAINLKFWREVSKQNLEGSTALLRSNKNKVSVVDVLLALCREPYHNDIKELLRISGAHCLLRHRIYDTWKRFNNAKLLSKNLRDSKTRLEWHVRRIYRARNLLIHSGYESPFLSNLCENLHYYVSSVLSRIIHGLSMNTRWKPEESAKHWSLLGEYVLDALNDSENNITIEDLMPKSNGKDKQLKPWNRP